MKQMTRNPKNPSSLWRRSVTVCLFAVALTACSEEEKAQAPVAEKRVSVLAAQATIGDVQSWVFAEGTARSVAREYLNFQNAGKVTYLKPGLREGTLVTEGDLLARQDQRSIKADLNEAKTQATLAEKTFKRYATLLRQKSASQQEYDEAKAQFDSANATLAKIRVAIEDTEIIAPINGMVAYLNIEQGQYFMPGIVRTDSEEAALNTIPIVLIDPVSYEISVSIPVYDRERVKIGQKVLVQAGRSQSIIQPSSAKDKTSSKNTASQNRVGVAPPDELSNIDRINGEVYSVNPAVSPSGRSIQVEIRTNDQNMNLKDGMYVTAWVAAQSRSNVVTAPLEAFIYRDNQPYVFVIDPALQKAQLREVTLGLQGFDTREVIAGVEANEWLVTDGRYQMSDGAKVRIINEARLEKGPSSE